MGKNLDEASTLTFTANAQRVLEARYLLRDQGGEVVETVQGLFERVANAVSLPEGKRKNEWAERFYNVMASRRFFPNSPTLFNAGKENGQLSACFVLPIKDSLDAVFESVKNGAKIHQSGGGTGFSFSQIRPAGDRVNSNLGVAAGPTAFIKIFDVVTETVKQGGLRRGANMAVLSVHHPDIVDFIDLKRSLNGIFNFNLSVGVTDEFMRAVVDRQNFTLRHPTDGRHVKEISAEGIFDQIAEAAWSCGDPGLVFLDRVNLFNPTPSEGMIESTNPCGEQPLLPFESCNLGSLNLVQYFERHGGINWERFIRDIHLSIRFLDNVIDVNHYPLVQSRVITLKNRKIGLGVMGFADLLLLCGISYDSDEARFFGQRIMSILDREAKRASKNLARTRGEFPNWKRSLWSRLGYRKMRNATVSTVAPTGTISMIAGVSSGIEPIFSGYYVRNVLSGERLVEIHPAVRAGLGEKFVDTKIPDDLVLRQFLGKAWMTARMISVADHVKMQASFQRHSDSAVSKTVNLPRSATVTDVKNAYLLAYLLGCKGITVYRDESRSNQVLEACSNC